MLSSDALDTIQALLQRVNPGGVLAISLPFRSEEHVLLRETAKRIGIDVSPLHTDALDILTPVALHDKCIGPLCAELKLWTTTYWNEFTDEHAVWQWLCSVNGGLTDVFESHGSDVATACRAEYTRRVAEQYRRTKSGQVLFPVQRLMIVAVRPSLLDIYQEYSAYHDHQLNKGWKS